MRAALIFLLAISSAASAGRDMAPPASAVTGKAWTSTGPTPVKPIVFRELFTAENYPFQARALAIEGRVGVRLKIGRDGLVKACSVDADAPPELAFGTCELILEKARFEPAMDSAGRAVEGSYRQSFRWALRDNEPVAFEAAFDRLIFRLTDDGKVESCVQEVSSPRMADARACEAASQNAVQAGATIPGSPPLGKVELIFETMWRPGTEPPELAKQEGLLVSNRGAHLDVVIAPSGRITDCTVRSVGMWDAGLMKARCKAEVGGLVEASAQAERRMQIVDFVYVRKRDAGAVS